MTTPLIHLASPSFWKKTQNTTAFLYLTLTSCQALQVIQMNIVFGTFLSSVRQCLCPVKT